MKPELIFTSVFGGIGLILLITTAFIVKSELSFLENAEVAKGKVVQFVYEANTTKTSNDDVEGYYYPIVEFSFDGKVRSFKGSVGSSGQGSYAQGEAVDVYYDRSAPENAQIKDFYGQWLLASVLGGVGLVFFVIGFLFLFFMLKKQKLNKWLLEFGQKIESEVASVQLNYRLKVNGRSPFRIHTTWLDKLTNTSYDFESDNIWFDPQRYIQNNKVAVYINPANPKEYHIDLSFLPKEGN